MSFIINTKWAVVAAVVLLMASCKKEISNSEDPDELDGPQISFTLNGEKKVFKANPVLHIATQTDEQGVKNSSLIAYETVSTLKNSISLTVFHTSDLKAGDEFADPVPPVPGHGLSSLLFGYTDNNDATWISMGAFEKFKNNDGMEGLRNLKYDSRIKFITLTGTEAKGTFSGHLYLQRNDGTYTESVITDGQFYVTIVR